MLLQLQHPQEWHLLFKMCIFLVFSTSRPTDHVSGLLTQWSQVIEPCCSECWLCWEALQCLLWEYLWIPTCMRMLSWGLRNRYWFSNTHPKTPFFYGICSSNCYTDSESCLYSPFLSPVTFMGISSMIVRITVAMLICLMSYPFNKSRLREHFENIK